MKRDYSVYEAKAKLSEIVRRVREDGETVTISYRGEPAAEVRPLPAPADDLARKVAELERRRILTPPSNPGATFPKALAKRPGGLARFLAERED